MVYYKDRCFFLCFKEVLSLQQKLLHRDELSWTLFMCTYYLNSSISRSTGFTGPTGKVNGTLTGWQVEPQGSFDWSEKQGVRPAKSNYKLKKESFTFSRPVDGSRVKMLLPAVSNTITKCLPKNIWLCKHWYTMPHKGWGMWKIFTKTVT